MLERYTCEILNRVRTELWTNHALTMRQNQTTNFEEIDELATPVKEIR